MSAATTQTPSNARRTILVALAPVVVAAGAILLDALDPRAVTPDGPFVRISTLSLPPSRAGRGATGKALRQRLQVRVECYWPSTLGGSVQPMDSVITLADTIGRFLYGADREILDYVGHSENPPGTGTYLQFPDPPSPANPNPIPEWSRQLFTITATWLGEV